ncbi:MAG: ABC transporter permease [Dermatophilus congolensis]|nr:ABC transporter permease [Dermatophilus congolensis]
MTADLHTPRQSQQPDQPTQLPTAQHDHAVKGGWRIVAGREIGVKLTDKAWVISTIVTTLLIIGIFVASSFMGARDSRDTVAVTSPDAAQLVAGTAAGQTGPSIPGLNTPLEAKTYPDDASAREAVTSGEAQYYLYAKPDGSWALFTESDPGMTTAVLGAAVSAHVMERNAQASGTSLAQLATGSQLAVEQVRGKEGDAMMGKIAGFVFAMIFYMASLVFGMTIAQSVVEEKQSRLAEIIATSVPMSSMLAGKVIGNSVLAFVQVLIYVAIALVGVSFTDIGGMMPALPTAVWWFLAFFIVGFIALAALWAVAGSLASRQEDLGYTSAPMMSIVVAAFMVPFFVEGQWLTITSYVPILSSIAMPMRVIAGGAAWWEPVVALALTALAALVLIRLGARLYRNSLLRTGGRITYREALKSVD